MLNCEKGGQWPLSSYAPFKEKANFPGFEDQSFEEVRLGFYTATTAGTLNQYVSVYISQFLIIFVYLFI